MNVFNGADRVDEIKKAIKGTRVGLASGPAGVTKFLRPTLDVLLEIGHVTALYGPEHGIRGDVTAGDPISEYTDSRTGLPVYSLYGEQYAPDARQLENIDIMVYDMQDIGCRFFTYLSTLKHIMDSCARDGKQVVVLDRVNPIGGVSVEGNLQKEEFLSFVGVAPIPQRHGMTVGELAKLFNAELNIGCSLTVVEVTGWERSVFFDQTDLFWVFPSPNIPTPDTALVYSGTCLFEGTNMSEGRGTTKPFEIIGAPWIDEIEYAKALNSLCLPGVIFRPTVFRPSTSKHEGGVCRGVDLHISDRLLFKPVETGLAMIDIAREEGKDNFKWLEPCRKEERYFIDLLSGSDQLRAGAIGRAELYDIWANETEQFLPVREKYLIY